MVWLPSPNCIGCVSIQQLWEHPLEHLLSPTIICWIFVVQVFMIHVRQTLLPLSWNRTEEGALLTWLQTEGHDTVSAPLYVSYNVLTSPLASRIPPHHSFCSVCIGQCLQSYGSHWHIPQRGYDAHATPAKKRGIAWYSFCDKSSVWCRIECIKLK